ncbi:MAG: hypothetical protein SA339_10925 [Methanomassiliicoccus sp.]|nr:hypothetical protein [Methanomassiliicoccus sp.]
MSMSVRWNGRGYPRNKDYLLGPIPLAVARRRKKRTNIKPILSAFVWGVLTGLGIDPGQMLVETTVDALGPYFQIAAVLFLFVVLYFSYNWIVEGLSRSRKAFRTAGVVGIAAIILAFLAGFFVFSWDKAAIMLAVSALAWLWATWK